MRRSEAFAKISRLGVSTISTAQAATALGLALPAASQMLTRLVEDGLMARLQHGLWALPGIDDPFLVAGAVAAPYPSYVSLASALREHGVLQQLPAAVQIVSLGRPQIRSSGPWRFEMHQIAPYLFGGFEDRGGYRLATLEKAIFDTVYLETSLGVTGRGRPEVILPPKIDLHGLDSWVEKIPHPPRREGTRRRLERFLSAAITEELVGVTR